MVCIIRNASPHLRGGDVRLILRIIRISVRFIYIKTNRCDGNEKITA